MKPLDPPSPSCAPSWPLLRLGFRPFYLSAAVFAALAVPLWIARFFGALTMPTALPPLLWHAHEMLFGFAAAVIVGFLMTASKTWTGLDTARGALLGALALLWWAARVAAVVAPNPTVWYGLYAILDLALLPIVAVMLLRVLRRAGNRRNVPLVALLFLLSCANLAFHLAVLEWVPLPPISALYGALGLIVMIECVMAGRVVPAFTANATPGLSLRINPRLEKITLFVTAVALALWVFMPHVQLPMAIAFAAAAVLHGLRQKQWAPWVTRDRPILWILHAAYAWIVVGFALLAAASMGWVPLSLGIHALGVGATGGLIIGMITRTARGHTGRPLRVGKGEVWAYLLVMAAAVLRVLVPLIASQAAPQVTGPALITAAMAWSAAFCIYLGLYTPWLTQARLDGKDG